MLNVGSSVTTHTSRTLLRWQKYVIGLNSGLSSQCAAAIRSWKCYSTPDPVLPQAQRCSRRSGHMSTDGMCTLAKVVTLAGTPLE
jgi:hypothetical protein